MVISMASAAPANSSPRAVRPSYKQMVLGAISSLAEKKGSSKRAIAKFIASFYSDLPLRHSRLLSRQLRNLQSAGIIEMACRCYKIRSGGDTSVGRNSAVPAKRRPGRPRKVALSFSDEQAADVGTGAVLEKRRPGRPRKMPAVVNDAVGLVRASGKRLPGRPPKMAGVVPAKRGPGRPSKKVMQLSPAGEKRKPGRPPRKLLKLVRLEKKRSPGRPRKSLAGSLATPDKRKPGRPCKKLPEAGPLVGEKRKPGRPRKHQTGDAAAAPTMKRKRGRPLGSSTSISTSSRTAIPHSEKRKPGRPRKLTVAVQPPPFSTDPGEVDHA